MTNNPYNQSERKYGQIAESKRINDFIYCCFEYVCEEDQQKFVKQFREQPHDLDQIMHTFRELILGAYLSANGFQVRHDYAVANKTPDWCILNDDSLVIGIVELMNFHIDKGTENFIREQRKTKRVIGYRRDGKTNNIARLYHRIDDKARKYHSLAKQLNIPYVVAVIGEFEVALDFDEICLCLFDEGTGLFDKYPELSGVLYFEDSARWYVFNYAYNPNALHPIELPIDVFPPEVT